MWASQFDEFCWLSQIAVSWVKYESHITVTICQGNFKEQREKLLKFLVNTTNITEAKVNFFIPVSNPKITF